MVSQIAARMTRYGTRLRRGEGVVSLVIDGPQRTRGGTTPYPRSLPAVGRFSPYLVPVGSQKRPKKEVGGVLHLGCDFAALTARALGNSGANGCVHGPVTVSPASLPRSSP